MDTGATTGSIAGEIVARVSMECFDSLKQSPQRIALPDYPTPTSMALTKAFYKCAEDIIDIVSSMLGKHFNGHELIDRGEKPFDIPGDWFKGPF